jgi:arylsulfatase A-like enzyme
MIGVERLFNLKKDPQEMKDLVNNPEYAAQLRELRAALSDLSEQMNDPMLGPSPTKASKQQR